MSAASLKLPDQLKRRLTLLARNAGQTLNAFMVEALSREAQRVESRAEFVADAAKAERETLESGRSRSLDSAFRYLESKLAGAKSKLPRARQWRGSK
jgi:predicted transcriptional regulator